MNTGRKIHPRTWSNISACKRKCRTIHIPVYIPSTRRLHEIHNKNKNTHNITTAVSTSEKLCNFTDTIDGSLMGNTSHQFAAMGHTTPYTSQKIGTINFNFTCNKLSNTCIT
jgi:hypothetical protein